MSERPWWSWPVFFTGFWPAMGRGAVVLWVAVILLYIFGNTSSADFESATFGVLFGFLVCGGYAVGQGEEAVRRWRWGE